MDLFLTNEQFAEGSVGCLLPMARQALRTTLVVTISSKLSSALYGISMSSKGKNYKTLKPYISPQCRKLKPSNPKQQKTVTQRPLT